MASPMTRIDQWIQAKQAVDEAKHDLRTCETKLANRAAVLAKSLVPESARPGETFNVWVDDDGSRRLLSVTILRTHNHKVEWYDE